jgi:hypothetical protein
VAVREADRVRAKHSQVSPSLLLYIVIQVNLHIFGPQVVVAANTFCIDPTSKVDIARPASQGSLLLFTDREGDI